MHCLHVSVVTNRSMTVEVTKRVGRSTMLPALQAAASVLRSRGSLLFAPDDLKQCASLLFQLRRSWSATANSQARQLYLNPTSIWSPTAG